ncbi:MAG: PPC domain-containing protein [Verrucomicrobia bacterium]|nr:PPC domain-containing protein [Verrucomicrobiota bacterium]
MSLIRWQMILGLGAALALLPAARAQQFTPHIGYVYPAGGKQGSSFELTLGGQYLDGVTNAFVTGSGISATVISYVKPITIQQFNDLRERLTELMKKKMAGSRPMFGRFGKRGSDSSTKSSWTSEDDKELDDIRKKIANFVRKPANPAIVETVTVKVSVSADAEPGERELRLRTTLGLTNPLLFCVSQLPEFTKKPAKLDDNVKSFEELKALRNKPEQTAVGPYESSITLPAIVNGQIMAGGVDRYRFRAAKGQRLVAAAAARELIPYISDAVPGWFQATLALYDASGQQVDYADHFRFHPDPVLLYEVPADGEYTLEIHDSIYRGREDFVYRITLGELPFMTGIFPLGGKAGTQTTVALKGWNLPATSLTLDAKDDGVRQISVRKDGQPSNLVPFAVDTLPESLEQEPNNSQDAAHRVTLPIIVNGRVAQPGDRDVFSFTGNAGDEIVAEVHARRLDSPLDSLLKLTDITGKQLALNDDHEDKASGLNTHHADSYLRVKLPASGTYFVHLGDTQRKGGAELAYRLRIGAPQADFALRIAPSSISVRPGATVPVTAYALRRDGFSGEISLSLKDAPSDFTLSGARVPPGQDKVRFTITAPSSSSDAPVALRIEGRAIIQGREIRRLAVPAEDMMQAFAYRHLVPAKELQVASAGLPPMMGRFAGKAPTSSPRILSSMPVRIPVGGTASVRVGMPTTTFFGSLELELNEAPSGIVIEKTSAAGMGTEIVLRADAKAKPGQQGNLIVSVSVNPKGQFAGKGKGMAMLRRNVATLPAISFEIVGK